jgi:Tol biopolymer transport system component
VRYVEPGYLVFVRDGTLMYVPFDAASLTIGGEPARLADGVSYFKPVGNAEFSASFNGVVTYRPLVGGQSLTWVDRSGQGVGTIGPTGAFATIRFSLDGSEVLADVIDLKVGTPDLWSYGTRRQTATRLTFGSDYESNPVMSPDGKWLFYSADALGVPDVFVKQLGSADADKPFWVESGEQYAQDVSPDGRVVLLTSLDYQSGTATDIYTAAADGSGKPTPFVRTPFVEQNPRFSPDGRTIAYQSNETGSGQIFVKPFPGPGRARQVSTAGGNLPRWSRDGTTADAEPRLLFETDRTFSTFEVAPDGQRFLMAMNDESAQQVPTRVMVNWPARIDAQQR